jgi:phosphoribosyl 1,2-cyclic phosphodiesterase
MRIKIWGCRGSLTTPGQETVKHGGNTTCFEVRLEDGTLIILDAGSGIHKLGNQLLGEPDLSEICLILSHSHWDHVLGFPFFTPAYMDKYTIHVIGGPEAKKSLKNYLAHQMDPPYFPVPFNLLQAHFQFDHDDPDEHSLGCADITPIALSHPNGAYGFKIAEGNKSFIFMTDNELEHEHKGALTREEYVSFCRNADLLIHDAQYSDEQYERTRGWGHSTYRNALRFASDAEVKRFGITHHDPDHSDEELDRQFTFCQDLIEGSALAVDCFFVREGMTIEL